jgi:polysaccharide pyruvyl transferase WcaK-like protein
MPWLLRRAAGIIVRDYRSLELCKRLGAGAVTRYAPDIVMHLPRFLPVPKPTKAADMYVAVCLRGRPNVYGRFDWNDVRTANFAAALDWLIAERGLRVVFLPFQTASGENDNSLHTAVRNRMQRADRAEIREWSGDLSEVASVLAGSRLVIAMRLHAAVVAAAFLRATVILPYDHKVAEFASQAAVGATLVAGDMDNALTIKAAFDAALTRAVSSRLSSEAAVWDSLTL